jgi:hypothetical protein
LRRIRSGFVSRGWLLGGLLVSTLIAVGCSQNANRSVTGSVGVTSGVTLVTSTGTTSLLEDEIMGLSASVVNDVNGAGVTWSLSGAGTLENATTTTVDFVAPVSGVTGSVSAIITARSIANPTYYAVVTIITLGSPEFLPASVILFPGAVGISYTGTVAAAGGDPPFTWTLVSGALPPGLAQAGSTSGLDYVSGVPTTQGSYSFVLQAEDALSRSAQVTVTMTVKPQSSCVLEGTYAYVYSGFTGGVPSTQAGSLTISSTGTITGVRDYKDVNGTYVADPVTGTCTTTTTNAGQLYVNGAKFGNIFNYAANAPSLTTSTSGTQIVSGRIQLDTIGQDSGSGQFALQDTTAFGAATIAGNYAFGMLGADGTRTINPAPHFGLAGAFALGADGTVSAGLLDSNDSLAPLSAAAMSGSFTAPDASTGRGTAALSAGGVNFNLAYYVVSATRMFIVGNDPATTAPHVSGFMTQQSGSFDNTAFVSNPGILSLWGAQGTDDPVAVLALGQLGNANAAAGSVDLTLDTASHDTEISGQPFTGSTYSVASNGRATLTFSGSSARQLVFYLDGPSDGYVVESSTSPGNNSGNAGLLEVQSTALDLTGDSNSECGQFVGGTQYPQSQGPISLSSAVFFTGGALSSTYSSGTFGIDSTTGYGLGTFTQTAVGVTQASLYVMQPADVNCAGAKVRMLRFATRAIDPSIEWFNE